MPPGPEPAARALGFCGAAILLAALILACASSAAAGEAEAAADAEARLASIALPPGAIPVSERPDGVSARFEGPPIEPGASNFIDRGSWWVTSEAPAEALAWFKANPPAGAAQRISGSDGGPGGVEYSFLGFEWPETSSLRGRTAFVGAAALPESRTAIRVDAQAIWIEPHPSSERIPGAARVLEVEWRGPKGHETTSGTANRRFIRSIAAELDRLPIAQPGLIHCPFKRADPPTVTLAFRARRGGPPLARAEQSLPPGICSDMSVTIRGKRRPALEDAGPVIARLRKLR